MEVFLCHCQRKPHPTIIFDDGQKVSNFGTNANPIWVNHSKDATIIGPTPHPDPDAVWADYCAACLRGDI